MNPRIPQALAGALLAVTLTACSADDAGTSSAASDSATTSSVSVASAVAAGSVAADVLAANAEVHESGLDYDEADVREITLSGQTASSDADAVTIDGGTVTITAPGTYRLSGTLTDGQVVVDSPSDGLVRLILAGADITSSTTAALSVVDADEVVVLLADGTANSLTDAAQYVHPDADTDEPNAALFSTADLTIAGSGTLAVTGRSNDGIASKDGLVIAGGTTTVAAADDGIRGKDYVVVDGGDITVTAGGDGVKADNAEDADKGFVVLREGTLAVEADDDGLAAASDVVITGGSATITAGGGAAAARASTDVSAKGIVAEAALVIEAGSVDVDAADDALHSNGVATIAGGAVTVAAGDDGVHADTDLTITGGQLEVTQSYEGLESANMTISDGEVSVTAEDDGINLAGGDGSAQAGPGDQADDFGGPAGGRGGGQGGGPGGFEEAGDYHLAISGGQVVIDADGDGLDSNGTAEISGGTVVVHGPTSNGNGTIDVNGTFQVTGGTLVAAGSAGMAEAPDDSSPQAWLAGSFASTQPEGSVIAIVADGEVIATFTATKQIQSIVFSAPDLVAGDTYEVHTGATPSGSDIAGLTSQGSIAGADLVGTTTASGAAS